jgi:putative flippase GtrA/4-amino-4-deoxy-L-arabinose transferase-like glycosyltransferase
MSQISSMTHQIRRFSLVGISNTAVDFIATNVLFFALRPGSEAGLLLVSVVACLIATGNSYWLNSRWTFGEVAERDRSKARFLATAGVGMIVNTAVFLFLMRHLPFSGVSNEFVLLNLSRIGGVLAAMTLTFCGYRLWAFAPSTPRDPCAGPASSDAGAPFPARSVFLLMALALAVRLVFLALAPVIYGDAVNYAWVARLTASGELDTVDLFWHSLFDFWQVLFVWLGAGQYQAPVLASLVPGVLLLWPVALITWRLYGARAAMLAGLVVALHPRLVEYSLNGYAESFYLLGCVWAVWGLLVLASEPRRRDAVLAAGVGLAAWILVRNEALLFAGLALLLAFLTRRRDWRGTTAAAVRVLSIVAVAITAYAVTNIALWGHAGLVEKRSNLARENVEMHDMHAAARETYGGTPATADDPDVRVIVGTLAGRWPANVKYVAERLPGVLLSPIFLFALLLPILRRSRRRADGSPVWPVVLMTLWPIGFYPLIQLEPRMLFPTLLGAIIFGSAGATLAGERLVRFLPRRERLARLAPGALALLPLILLLPVLAWHTSSERGFHRDVGRWLATTVPPDVRIVGDGYGYVSASAFWAGRQAEPRVWTDESAVLAESVAEDAVLILYERYLRDANPELLATLDEGLPGMVRVAEFEFPRVGRVQAWQHGPAAH